MDLTWEELGVKPVGFVLLDEYRAGIRFIILRASASLCAYIGIPDTHPLAGFDYEALPSIDCHGGLTFASAGDGAYLPKGFYWYGWDYAHAGDCCLSIDGYTPKSRTEEKRWLVKDVVEKSYWAVENFRTLMNLVERIKSKEEK